VQAACKGAVDGWRQQLPLWCPDLMCLFLPVLQKAQKKMLDVINSVGLSSSVLKMIERRHKNDLYMALGGMVCRDWLHNGCWSWVTAAVSGGSVPRTCCSGSSACSQHCMCSVLFGVLSFRPGCALLWPCEAGSICCQHVLLHMRWQCDKILCCLLR
jgi:hypothetical protein